MTLKALLLEWKKYSAISDDSVPARTLNKEKESIKRAVKLKLEEAEEAEISSEDQKIVNEILNYVEDLD